MLISQFFKRSTASAPLLILVHGRAGNVQVMQAFNRILPEDCNIVSVQAPMEDPEGGFSWWHFDKQKDLLESRSSGALEAAAIFFSWLAELRSQEQLFPKQIIGIGFSQGAALLSCLAQLNPSLFNAIAMLAGFVVKVPDTESQLGSFKQKPGIFMAHGENDEIISFDSAQKGKSLLIELGFEVEFVAEQVGHKLGVLGMKSLKSWLESQLNAPLFPAA